MLALAAEEMARADVDRQEPLVRIGGICGDTGRRSPRRTCSAATATTPACSASRPSVTAGDDALVAHCARVAELIPIVGFYLQPAVGGRALSYAFWRRFAEIDDVVAIKIAPFNRYQTLDVVRAVADAGRDDVALYTGNDDNIVGDLRHAVSNSEFARGPVVRRIVGGLLGHWAVWTRTAVELLQPMPRRGGRRPRARRRCSRKASPSRTATPRSSMRPTRSPAASPGLHEVLHRQGLLGSPRCLDPDETLGPGQREEIDRVCASYPHLNDDAFVEEHRDEWLA